MITHDMTRLSYTNTVSVNYFLSVRADCEVSQSCFITILNKLPNLTALNFDGIDLPANEREVNLHNVQMRCIHVCPVTQPAQHACVYRVSCARGHWRERVSSTFSRFHGRGYINSDMHTCSQFHCTSKLSTVNWIGCPYSYVPSTHHMTLDLASCPSRDVCDDITLLHSIVEIG